MTKKSFIVIKEFLPDTKLPVTEEVGHVIVNDDLSVEWEYDGKFYPYVRKTIHEAKREHPDEIIGPTSSSDTEEVSGAVEYRPADLFTDIARGLRGKPTDHIAEALEVETDTRDV